MSPADGASGRGDSMSGFKLQRMGTIMEPEPGNPHEVDGVLNPGAIRGPDGELYFSPRLVAKGDYSRIGVARVRFNKTGDRIGVERLGIALDPEADYELRPGGGGCEAGVSSFSTLTESSVVAIVAHPFSFSATAHIVAAALRLQIVSLQR